MTRPPPLALGLAGCGRLAEAGYLPALAAVPELRLVAVADPDPVRRDGIADGVRHATGGRVSTHADAMSLLAAGALDVLILATPAHSHTADAAAAAAAGVPVLVEKPPAVDAAGAARLAALRPAPWVGFNRRFDPGIAALKAAVPASGRLDVRLHISYRRRSWQAHEVHDDALLDLGPHVVDLALWLSGGEATDVRDGRTATERATFRVGLGRAGADVTVATDRPHRELVEIRDDRGARLARHRAGGLVSAVTGRLGPRRDSPLVASLAGQLRALAAAVRDAPDTRPGTGLGTAADGLAVMEVVEAVRASAAAEGRTVTVAERAAR